MGVIVFFVLKVDGFNNVIDIIVLIVVLVGLKIFKKFCDNDYFYGYFRVEYIFLFIVFFIMMVIGLEVLVDVG